MRFRFGKRKAGGFAEAMIASFPPGLAPPEPFILFFRWLEENQLDAVSEHDGRCYAILSPAQRDLSIIVEPVDPRFAIAWNGTDNPEAAGRMAAFIRTGGDGSYAGLWRDDEGAISIVHHGSGSGSTMLCTLSTDPVDLLRLLAIGYDELCWPEQYRRTPEEIHEHRLKSEEWEVSPPVIPLQFRRWVEETFNVTIPQTASEIVSQTADMDAADSDDPFWRWIRSLEQQ